MESFLTFVRLALENAPRIGALLTFFFGFALLADSNGIRLPAVLKEWSWAGLILGLAVISLATCTALARMLDKGARLLWAKRQEARNVLEALPTLTLRELEILGDFLSSEAPQIEIHPLSEGYVLVEKGMLKPVGLTGRTWLCKVHPALAADREC